MNTGIQDAQNLAWKLALVVRGVSPDSLLDSYSAERRPVVAGVVEGTDLLTRMVTLRNPLAKAVRNHLASLLRIRLVTTSRSVEEFEGATWFGTPNPCRSAGTTLTGSEYRTSWHPDLMRNREVIPGLILSEFDLVARKVSKTLSELGVEYHASPITAEDVGKPFLSKMAERLDFRAGPRPGVLRPPGRMASPIRSPRPLPLSGPTRRLSRLSVHASRCRQAIDLPPVDLRERDGPARRLHRWTVYHISAFLWMTGGSPCARDR